MPWVTVNSEAVGRCPVGEYCSHSNVVHIRNGPIISVLHTSNSVIKATLLDAIEEYGYACSKSVLRLARQIIDFGETPPSCHNVLIYTRECRLWKSTVMSDLSHGRSCLTSHRAVLTRLATRKRHQEGPYIESRFLGHVSQISILLRRDL